MRQVSELLAFVRKQVDGLVRNDELRDVLRSEQRWLMDAERVVSEVRAWREQEMARFWPAVWRRWAVAVALAVVSSWAASAGYAWVTKPYDDELAALRARVEVLASIEQRLAVMSPRERQQFDSLMNRSSAPRGNVRRR